MRRSPLVRRTPLRARSLRMARRYVQRRRLVAEILEAWPICQRCGLERSTEVHEPLLRSRGGNILDPDACVALCHGCHSWIHENPAAATAEAWMKSAEPENNSEAAADDFIIWSGDTQAMRWSPRDDADAVTELIPAEHRDRR